MREKILKEAFKLIAKKNVKDVSMREISQACDITKPSLYYYFKDKDEICFTIVDFIIKRNNKDLQEYIDKNMALKDILFDIFTKNCQLQGKKFLSFFLHFVDYVMVNDKLEKRLIPLKKTGEELLKKIFLKEVDKKNITLKDAKIGFYLLQACVHDMVFNKGKMNDDYPKDMSLAILRAINYKLI